MPTSRATAVALALAALALLLPAGAQPPPLPPLPVPAQALPAYPYHTYATLTLDLQDLAAAHPGLVRLASLGKSRGGLDLWSVEIANFSDPATGTLPAFVLDGGLHGDEPLSVEAAYLAAAALAEDHDQVPAVRALVDAHRVFVVPMANPDGATARTRGNAALVDLDRNFPFHWGERAGSPGQPDYAGPAAASEPETQALLGLFAREQPVAYVSLRAGGPGLVRPFGQAPNQSVPDEPAYEALLGWAQDHGNLAARWPSGTGTSCDWAYGAAGAFCVAQEVGQPPAPLLPGPVTSGDVAATLRPALNLTFHVLDAAEYWGGHVALRLDALQGDRAQLVLGSDGFEDARNFTFAATGITLESALPRDLAAGEEARVDVRVDAPAQGLLGYDRLALATAPSRANATVEVPFRTAPLDEGRPTPAPAAPAALLAAGLAAAASGWRRLTD